MKFTITEMNGLLNGKCIPTDLLVGETLSAYLVRKLSLSDQLLTEASRYGRQADITIENLERKVEQLAAENAGLKKYIADSKRAIELWNSWADAEDKIPLSAETPATNAFLDEVRADHDELICASLLKKACEYEARAKEVDCHTTDNRYRFAAAMFRGFAAQLRQGGEE